MDKKVILFIYYNHREFDHSTTRRIIKKMPKNDKRKAPTKDSATGMVAADSLAAAAAGVGTDAEGPGAGAGANTSFFAIVAVMEAARMRTAHKIIFISMAKRLSKLVK